MQGDSHQCHMNLAQCLGELLQSDHTNGTCVCEFCELVDIVSDPAQFGKDRLQIFHQRNFLTECGSNQKIRAGKFCFCRLAIDDFKFLFRYTDGNIVVSDSQRITPLLLFFDRGAGLARIKCAGGKPRALLATAKAVKKRKAVHVSGTQGTEGTQVSHTVFCASLTALCVTSGNAEGRYCTNK